MRPLQSCKFRFESKLNLYPKPHSSTGLLGSSIANLTDKDGHYFWSGMPCVGSFVSEFLTLRVFNRLAKILLGLSSVQVKLESHLKT